MIQKLKNKLLVLSMMVFAIAPVAVTGVAAAQVNSPIAGGVCKGADTLQVSSGTTNTCTVQGDPDGGFNALLTKIINVMSVIVGVVAVIMIIIGGFRYITSGGDSTKVAGAKNTILYGLIGLVIVALAQVIVRFVLKQVTDPNATL